MIRELPAPTTSETEIGTLAVWPPTGCRVSVPLKVPGARLAAFTCTVSVVGVLPPLPPKLPTDAVSQGESEVTVKLIGLPMLVTLTVCTSGVWLPAEEENDNALLLT